MFIIYLYVIGFRLLTLYIIFYILWHIHIYYLYILFLYKIYLYIYYLFIYINKNHTYNLVKGEDDPWEVSEGKVILTFGLGVSGDSDRGRKTGREGEKGYSRKNGQNEYVRDEGGVPQVGRQRRRTFKNGVICNQRGTGEVRIRVRRADRVLVDKFWSRRRTEKYMGLGKRSVQEERVVPWST